MKKKLVKELPKVDVLIISYNQENVIEEAILSVLNQTYLNTQIIVADDCSTDKTRSIIEKLQFQFPNKITKVFNKKNLGITSNSNAGLKKCQGDYFVFMGGDDVLYSTKIEEQINWFKQNPNYSLCGHNLNLIDENSNYIGKYKSNNKYNKGKGAYDWVKYGMLFGCMSIMIKKDLNFDLNFDTRLKYSSDLLFYIDFLSTDKKFGYINKELGSYRKSETSITSGNFDKCMNDSRVIFNILKTQNQKIKKMQDAIKYGENYLLNYGVALYYMKTDKEKSKALFLKSIKSHPFMYKAYLRLLQLTFQRNVY